MGAIPDLLTQVPAAEREKGFAAPDFAERANGKWAPVFQIGRQLGPDRVFQRTSTGVESGLQFGV